MHFRAILFLVNDTTLPSDNSLRFGENLVKSNNLQ